MADEAARLDRGPEDVRPGLPGMKMRIAIYPEPDGLIGDSLRAVAPATRLEPAHEPREVLGNGAYRDAAERFRDRMDAGKGEGEGGHAKLAFPALGAILSAHIHFAGAGV